MKKKVLSVGIAICAAIAILVAAFNGNAKSPNSVSLADLTKISEANAECIHSKIDPLNVSPR